MNCEYKINQILKKLLNEDPKLGITNNAGYWKIGTSIFKTFDRLYENIKDIDISSPICVKTNMNVKISHKNKYYFDISKINVTPTVRKTKNVSDSAIHQYNSMICSFGLGANDKYYENKIDLIKQNGIIILNAQIKNLLNESNRLNLIKKIIIDSLFSNVSDTRNIAYSILMEILFSCNFNMNLLDDENRIFYWRKVIGTLNRKTIKTADLKYDLLQIKKDIENQGTKATYKEIVECFKNETNLEDFINDIWNGFESINASDDEYYDKIVEKQIMELNIKAMIKSERSKFKNNIFNERRKNNLINNKSDLYTDIVDLNNSHSGLQNKFNEAEAAHIFDVFRIKEKLLKINQLNQELINSISNPNNGLIMSHDYHKSFDRRQWFFDANGIMVVPPENQNYLFNIKQLKQIKIRSEILNEEMKNFLKKR